MNLIEFACRSDEARKQGIEFLAPDERSRWPKPHSRRFEDIKELGRETCDSFVETLSEDISTKPWRTELPKRAERLSSLADRCYREDSGNEFGWRFKVENEIMYRFTVEVACPICRKRIWESEIPVALTGSSEDVEMLEYRRRNRKPCRCPKGWGDNFGGGISILFSDRAEARIKHDPPLQTSLQPPKFKHSEVVDRIYGLRQTDKFRLVLDSIDKRYIETRNIPLRESIKFSPLSSGGNEPLLFPFLIMEAKSSKGRSRSETHMQSAFCIRQLLEIQRDLVTAAEYELQDETDPLIWYIATRGEQWDIYAGFVEVDQDITRYIVLELWSGNIRHRDAALQILLIVDYIFDWARDVYRKAILDQLVSLSISDFGLSDPDVFSTISRQMSHISSQNEFLSYRAEHSQASFAREDSVEESNFLKVVLPEGVIRDAAIIESRYILIRMTENNINDFLSLFQYAHDAQSWVSMAFKCLEGSWRVSTEALLSMESIWTGTHREQSEDNQLQQTFYLSTLLSIFMTDDWEPVRQLACFALSEGCLEYLAAKFGYIDTFRSDDHPEVEKSSVESILHRTLNQSIMDNLTAAVSMLFLSSCFYNRNRRMDNHLRVSQSNGMSAGFRVDRSPRMAQLVHHVYANHQFGSEDFPSSPMSYLRFSRIRTRNEVQYRGTTIEMWPQLPRLVAESRHQAVLVDGASVKTNFPSRGLFLFSEFPNYQSLSRVVDRIFEEGIYFRTLQLGSDFISSDNFRYLNQPLKFNRDWKDQLDPDLFMLWKQRLEDIMATQGYPEGAAFSCPIILSSDDETETEE